MRDYTITELLKPLHQVWERQMAPLLSRLDAQMDCRLVATLAQSVRAILGHRHRNCGLLLSELGGVLLGGSHAPAGTKRLSNLLRSDKWSASDIASHLWQGAQEQVAKWQQNAPDVWMMWDESVVEKPESQQAQGLSPVRSSKAARLSRIKPGYYRPPGAPVFVPGFAWMALLVIAPAGPPCVAVMEWWGTRSKKDKTATAPAPATATATATAPAPATATATATATAPVEPWLEERATLKTRLLRQCHAQWGRTIVHLFDRGFAGAPWIGELHEVGARWVMRWPKAYKLLDTAGEGRAAWQHLRGKRSWSHQMMPDARRKQWSKRGVIATRVFHAAYGEGREPLWLVACRSGSGREPWYLLTNEPVESAEQAWRIVKGYARRWQIETSFRYTKSELALESPRLWSWERRLKLMMIVTLVYALLLELLRLPREWLDQVLRQGCHRTGKRNRETPAPLYRLRIALKAFFNEHPPDFMNYQSSG